MNRPIIWLMATVAGALALAGGWWRYSGRPIVQLPEAVAYSHLPARFSATLADAYRDAVARRGGAPAVRRLARLYQANRLDREAQICYAWLARNEGGLAAQDHYLLAELALNAGDIPRAQAALRAVLEAEPSYLLARQKLAETLFKSGDEDSAAAEYDAILAREPDHPQALLGLARLALQRRDDASAIARLERLLGVHPEATSAAALLAQVMTRRGETERAEALAEWSQHKPDPVPADPWLESLFAECYDLQRLTLRFEELVNTGQLEEALPLLERVEELDPRSWLPPLLRGWTHDRAGQREKAAVEYRRALERAGDPERITTLLVPCLLKLGRVSEALDAVERAIQLRPDAVALLGLQAEIVLGQGDHTRARSLLTRLLKKAPYIYTANMSLAHILWSQGERDEAVVCLARVAKAFPLDVASRGLLGEYYLTKGDALAAVPPLEQALPRTGVGSAEREQLSKMLVSASMQAGAAQVAAGRPEDAAAYFEKAARLSAVGADALAQLAGELAQSKRFRAAADALMRLAGLQPDNATIEISLGDMLYQEGDTAAARTHWEKALALAAPTDVALRGALERRLSGHITPDLFN